VALAAVDNQPRSRSLSPRRRGASGPQLTSVVERVVRHGEGRRPCARQEHRMNDALLRLHTREALKTTETSSPASPSLRLTLT
jgi:hypothetical protein